jgi:hypothetical protein
MSVTPAFRGRRFVATALAKAEAFLLEPVEAAARPAAITLRPVVALVALAPGCGTTTVARAVALELAARDPAGAAVVSGSAAGTSLALAGGSATKLARALGSGVGDRLRTAGRLCLVEGGDESALAGSVRHLAPLVIDVGHGEPAGVAVSIADHAILVAAPAVEPALAAAVAASLARIGPPPEVVLNRAGPEDTDIERWNGRTMALVGRSGTGARLALAGRSPRGALGEGVAEIAEACAERGSDW